MNSSVCTCLCVHVRERVKPSAVTPRAFSSPFQLLRILGAHACTHADVGSEPMVGHMASSLAGHLGSLGATATRPKVEVLPEWRLSYFPILFVNLLWFCVSKQSYYITGEGRINVSKWKGCRANAFF